MSRGLYAHACAGVGAYGKSRGGRERICWRVVEEKVRGGDICRARPELRHPTGVINNVSSCAKRGNEARLARASVFVSANRFNSMVKCFS